MFLHGCCLYQMKNKILGWKWIKRDSIPEETIFTSSEFFCFCWYYTSCSCIILGEFNGQIKLKVTIQHHHRFQRLLNTPTSVGESNEISFQTSSSSAFALAWRNYSPRSITPPRFYERVCVPLPWLRLGANWGYWPSDSVLDHFRLFWLPVTKKFANILKWPSPTYEFVVNENSCQKAVKALPMQNGHDWQGWMIMCWQLKLKVTISQVVQSHMPKQSQ
jgi:hypothetical protein